MRLIVVINAFNEAKNIAKTIESVHDVADEIWLFDGAYKEYPHSEVYSTDGTLEIASKYSKVKIYPCTKAWANQLEKRTAMFKDGMEGDYFLRLDGDEYVTNPEDIKPILNALNGIDVGYCWQVSNLYPEPYMVARLFKWRKGMHYAGRHHWLFDGDNTFMCSDQHLNPAFRCQDTKIKTYNFRDSSAPKRKDDKAQFLNNRQSYEGIYQREDEVYPDKFVRLIEHPNRAGKPVFQDIKVLRETDHPEYTFTLMFSRAWAVKRYLECLKSLFIPKHTEAIVVIDSTQPYIISSLMEHFLGDMRFEGVKIIITHNPQLSEFADVMVRRMRIIQNWHLILTNARGKYILGSEDDSLPDPNAYLELIRIMQEEKADFVQGNIIGRWHSKMCPAWQVVEKDSEPIAVYTPEERSSGLQRIQGCGWYCFITTADLMRKYKMDVDEIMPLGPDLRFGYLLHKNGYKLLHSWDIKVEHFGEGFNLIIGQTPVQQLMAMKKNGVWNVHQYNGKDFHEFLKLNEVTL